MAADSETPDEETAAPEAARAVEHVARDQYVERVTALRDEGWTMVVDLTAVDYLGNAARALPEGVAPERFEVVATLLSFAEKRRVRLRVQVPESDPTCPSLFQLYPGTEAMEREVWDMYGIAFTDH